jgi:anti-sigma-K factor RskA
MSDDIHMLSGAYAVDALDDAERAAFEAHLSGCPDCQSEVASLRETAILLTELEPLTPPPDLRDRLLEAVSQTRPLPPLAATEPATTPSAPTAPTSSAPEASVTDLGSRRVRRSARVWGSGLLAAAVAVIAVVSFWHPWTGGPGQTGVERIIAAADTHEQVQTLPGGGSMRVYRSVSLDKTAVVATDLPDPGKGKVYEVWYQNDEGAMIPAALLPSNEASSVVLKGSAAAATAAGVTVEPAGGSPAPTTEPVMLFGFDDTDGGT